MVSIIPTVLSDMTTAVLEKLEDWKQTDKQHQASAHGAIALLRRWSDEYLIFMSDQDCFDWRLRNLPGLVSLVKRHLCDLLASVNEILKLLQEQRTQTSAGEAQGWCACLSLGPRPCPSISASKTMTGIIKRLNADCTTINKCTKPSDLFKVFDKPPEESDLENLLSRESMARIVDEMFPKAKSALRWRLVGTIMSRRKDIRLFQKMGKTRTAKLNRAEPRPDRKGKEARLEVLENDLKNHASNFQEHEPRGYIDGMVIVYTPVPEPIPRSIEPMIPPAPTRIPSTGLTKCPYCCELVPHPDELLGDTWSSHFIKDQIPYVCVLDGCRSADNPDVTFMVRKSWIDHLEEDDPMTYWDCKHPDHPTPYSCRFLVRAALEQHMLTEHPDTYRDAKDIAGLVDESKCLLPSRYPLTECPLCPDADILLRLSYPELEDHVAGHLIELAIRPVADLKEEDD